MLSLNIFAMGFLVAGGIIVLSVLVGGFFVWIGAKLARVEKGTFGRAILAAIAASIASWLVAALFTLIPGPWWIGLIGAIIGLVVVLWVFKSMFDCTWGKAFLIWIFQLIAMVIVTLVAAFTFAATMVL
ncbi:hypothetical protein ACFL2B_01070 [Patescibacteria group bacterium]